MIPKSSSNHQNIQYHSVITKMIMIYEIIHNDSDRNPSSKIWLDHYDFWMMIQPVLIFMEPWVQAVPALRPRPWRAAVVRGETPGRP